MRGSPAREFMRRRRACGKGRRRPRQLRWLISLG